MLAPFRTLVAAHHEREPFLPGLRTSRATVSGQQQSPLNRAGGADLLEALTDLDVSAAQEHVQPNVIVGQQLVWERDGDP